MFTPWIFNIDKLHRFEILSESSLYRPHRNVFSTWRPCCRRCLWLSWSEWKFAQVKGLSTQKLLVYTCGSWALLALLLAGKISTTTMNLGKRLSPASLRRYPSSVHPRELSRHQWSQLVLLPLERKKADEVRKINPSPKAPVFALRYRLTKKEENPKENQSRFGHFARFTMRRL